MLERLKVLMPKADEARLSALLAQCMADFSSICGRDDVPSNAEPVIEQMVAFRYSQLGAEGLSNQSFSGISESHRIDYPEALKRAMYRYRKLRAT